MSHFYRKFKKCVEKITNVLCDGGIPERLVDAVVKFDAEVNACRLNEAPIIKDLIDGLSKPQMDLWPDYARSTTLLQMEWKSMHKRSRFRMQANELIDRNSVVKYSRLQTTQVCSLINFVGINLVNVSNFSHFGSTTVGKKERQASWVAIT